MAGVIIRHVTCEKPAVFFWIAIVALGGIVAAAFAWTCDAIAREAASYPLSRGLPVAVMPASATFPSRVAAEIVICGVVEAAALWSIARLIAATAPPPQAVAATMTCALAVMGTIAFSARGSTSLDPYTYAQYAKTRTFAAAYAPTPNEPLPGPFRATGVYSGPEPVPCVYGPLWLWSDRVLISGAATPAEAFARLRFAGIVELALFVALLAFAGLEAPVLVALVLCPTLYLYFVVEAHNDLLALGILAAAGALLRTPLRAGAAVVAACAALVKLNFALLALATLARPQPGRARATEALIVVAIALGGSELLAGPAYFAAIAHVGAHRPPGMTNLKFFSVEALKLAAASIATTAILMAFVRDRWWRSATWTMPALASAIWPWYGSWGLPFALRVPALAATFVASLPLIALALDHAVTMGLKAGLVSLYLIGAIGFALAKRSTVALVTGEENQ